jgi:DTW domain-containing protein YfiP
MGRSVVLAGAARCPRCNLPPRWCICDAIPPLDTRLRVHVLIHRGEQHRPSSTGMLVTRAVAGAISHVYQRATRFFPASGFSLETADPHGELWILHPSGDPLPASATQAAGSDGPRVVLLDGTWRQANEMLRSIEGLGRRVRLPDATAEPSRYWLRDQPEPTHLSTAEALMGVLRASGEAEAERRLRLHFELHVYATLLSRGRREMAERYLGHSPLRLEAPDALDRLHARRHTEGPRSDDFC